MLRNIKPDFVDERGSITKLLNDGKMVIRSILVITSRKGSIRANHYHKKAAHYSYLVSGKGEYTEQPVGSDGKLCGKKESVIIKAGEMVYSAPMTVHAIRFLDDSVFLEFSAESSQQADYEEDSVRVKLV